jgi:hypothetical protein
VKLVAKDESRTAVAAIIHPNLIITVAPPSFTFDFSA